MDWLSEHIRTITILSTAIGALGAAAKWFPGLLRGLMKGAVRVAVGWFLYETEREKNLALEERVTELLEEVEKAKRQSQRNATGSPPGSRTR